MDRIIEVIAENFSSLMSPFPLPETEALALRKELLTFGVFKEAGEKTLRATLKDDATLTAMPKVYDFILDKMSTIVKKY